VNGYRWVLWGATVLVLAGCPNKAGTNAASNSDIAVDAGLDHGDASLGADGDSGPEDTGQQDNGPQDAGTDAEDAADTSLDAAVDVETDAASTEPGYALFFQSGFEEGVSAVELGTAKCSGDIQGSDGAFKGNWVDDLETAPIAEGRMCYGGADDCALAGDAVCQRGMERVDDPQDASNTVLRTWIAEPAEEVNDPDDMPCSGANGLDTAGSRKSRAQFTLIAQTPVPAFVYSVRLRLGEAFTVIHEELGMDLDWMTIGEFWNVGPQNINMGDRSRVTVNLVKETASEPFKFGLKGDYQPDGTTGWTSLWSGGPGHLVSDQVVPIGEWFTLRIEVVAGDANVGRTVVDFTPDGGETVRLFEVSDATIYPGTDILGFTAIQPVKVYTAGNLTCWLKAQTPSHPLEAWWDDFALYLPDES